MPKYVYHCDECDEQFEAYHGMSDSLNYCELCDSQDSVKRIPQMLFIKKSQGKKKVGSVVKEYIEDTKKELREEKKRLSQQEYKT